MSVSFDLPAELLDALAERVIERLQLIAEQGQPSPWLNTEQAADYLATTTEAVRGMVKRGQIPVERTPTGRLLFSREALDAWVRDAA